MLAFWMVSGLRRHHPGMAPPAGKTSAVVTRTVAVEGAELYTERRGSGPPLVLIPGGLGDAGSFADAAASFAEHFTVLSFDRRGNSRSRLTVPPEAIEVAQESSDALAVLDAYGFTSALMVGSSASAVFLLDLVARYPEAVELAVIHEPPLLSMLGGERQAWFDALRRVAADEGGWPAFVRFVVGLNAEPEPRVVRGRAGRAILAWLARTAIGVLRMFAGHAGRNALVARMMGNAEYFAAYEMQSIVRYQPDLDKLSVVRDKLVVAHGQTSRGYFYARAGLRLAERVGCRVLELPGGHDGYMRLPEQWAAALTPTLAPSMSAARVFGYNPR